MHERETEPAKTLKETGSTQSYPKKYGPYARHIGEVHSVSINGNAVAGERRSQNCVSSTPFRKDTHGATFDAPNRQGFL